MLSIGKHYYCLMDKNGKEVYKPVCAEPDGIIYCEEYDKERFAKGWGTLNVSAFENNSFAGYNTSVLLNDGTISK